MGEEHSRKRISLCKGPEERIWSIWAPEVFAVVEMQSGQQGPGGDGALWAPPRWGKVHRHDSGGHAYPWCTELWVRLTLGGKVYREGQSSSGR